MIDTPDSTVTLTFADRLRALRRSEGLTQATLAERVGATQRDLSQIESGFAPPAPLQAAIADVLGVSPAAIFDAGPSRPPLEHEGAHPREADGSAERSGATR